MRDVKPLDKLVVEGWRDRMDKVITEGWSDRMDVIKVAIHAGVVSPFNFGGWDAKKDADDLMGITKTGGVIDGPPSPDAKINAGGEGGYIDGDFYIDGTGFGRTSEDIDGGEGGYIGQPGGGSFGQPGEKDLGFSTEYGGIILKVSGWEDKDPQNPKWPSGGGFTPGDIGVVIGDPSYPKHDSTEWLSGGGFTPGTIGPVIGDPTETITDTTGLIGQEDWFGPMFFSGVWDRVKTGGKGLDGPNDGNIDGDEQYDARVPAEETITDAKGGEGLDCEWPTGGGGSVTDSGDDDGAEGLFDVSGDFGFSGSMTIGDSDSTIKHLSIDLGI